MFHFYIICLHGCKERERHASFPCRHITDCIVSIHWWLFPKLLSLYQYAFFFIFSLPTCLMCSSVLGYVWLYWLENPSPDLVPNYSLGVLIVLISVFIETIAEPVYVFSRIYHFVKLKVTNFILICFYVPLVLFLKLSMSVFKIFLFSDF